MKTLALVIFNHDWCDQYRAAFRTLSNQRHPTSVTFLISGYISRSHDPKISIHPNWFIFLISTSSSVTFIGKVSVTLVFNVYKIGFSMCQTFTSTNWQEFCWYIYNNKKSSYESVISVQSFGLCFKIGFLKCILRALKCKTVNSEKVMNDKMSIYDCGPPTPGIAMHSRTILSRIHFSKKLDAENSLPFKIWVLHKDIYTKILNILAYLCLQQIQFPIGTNMIWFAILTDLICILDRYFSQFWQINCQFGQILWC